jgi:hypothetical protein
VDELHLDTLPGEPATAIPASVPVTGSDNPAQTRSDLLFQLNLTLSLLPYPTLALPLGPFLPTRSLSFDPPTPTDLAPLLASSLRPSS